MPVAAEDLFLDSDGKVVGAGPEARTLVARGGRQIPRRFESLVTKAGQIKAEKPVADKAAPPAENKAKTQVVKKRGGKK